MPGEPRQADRPPPLPLGFRPIPEVEDLDEAVVVEGFRLLPSSGTAGWEVHPKALLGVAWDDNPLLAQGGSTGDVQQRYALGCELRGQGEDGWRFDLDGMLRAQRYERIVGRDHTGGNALVRLRHDGDTVRSVLEGSWERSTEAVVDIPEQVDRERLEATVHLAGNGRRTAWNANLAWSSLDYRSGTAYYDDSDRNQQRLTASGGWFATGVDESLLGVEARTCHVDRPTASPAHDYGAVALNGRWRHALGKRSAIDLRIGVEGRQYDNHTAGLTSNDDRMLLGPVVSARLIWGWETHSMAILGLSSAMVDGMTKEANAAQREAIDLWGRVRLLDRLDLVCLGWLAQREDSGARQGQTHESALDSYLRLGLDYRLRDGLGIRPWVSWQHHSSLISTDYDRLLLALELVAAL